MHKRDSNGRRQIRSGDYTRFVPRWERDQRPLRGAASGVPLNVKPVQTAQPMSVPPPAQSQVA